MSIEAQNQKSPLDPTDPGSSDQVNDSSPEDFKKNIIVNIVVENFFIPAILKPEQHGIISGLLTDFRCRNNLAQVRMLLAPNSTLQIARMILDLLLNPDMQKYLVESGLDRKFENFMDSVIDVEDIDPYFEGVEAEYFYDNEKTRLMVSSTDIFLILELVFHNYSSTVSW
jgi:hypothetical protein